MMQIAKCNAVSIVIAKHELSTKLV